MRLCNRHPKYRALRRPRVDCPTCWMAYVEAEKDRIRKEMQDADGGSAGVRGDVADRRNATALERRQQ